MTRLPLRRTGLFAIAVASIFAVDAAAPPLWRAPAGAASALRAALPAPPANGEMGFLVQEFSMPTVHDKDACPDGRVPSVREAFLKTLPNAERQRLLLKENEPELTRRWQATVFAPDGSNMCSQPDRFQRTTFPELKSRYGWGMDLDGGSSADSCAHETFETPTGQTGIDNQEYRALGCSGPAPSADENENRAQRAQGASGFNQFFASGEWTQVILLRGVDSLQNDPEVQVIYGNTPDRPAADSSGHFLRGSSFTISDTAPRHRNVLRGRIVDGVLTTEPADIALTQTWGQGGTREIRGARSKFMFYKGRLRLEFQPDGSLRGMLGGYRPPFELLAAEALGGAGSATTAGLDCGAKLATAKKLADGIRDPKTGKCTAISSARTIGAIPAFVNDAPAYRTAKR